MSAEQPMTAAKMLDDLLTTSGDELWSERVYRILVRMLEWMAEREREHAEIDEMKRQIGEMGQRPTNEEGLPGTYGCRCTSRNALECAQQAYYAGVEARERCGCLCHQWTESGAWQCLTGGKR